MGISLYGKQYKEVIVGTAVDYTDTDGSNTLRVTWNENDSSDRTLGLAVSGGNKTITLTGNPSIGTLTLAPAAVGFTIAGGTTSKTLTVSNTLTLAGTDTSTLNISTGGTLGTAAFTAATAYEPTFGIATWAGTTNVVTLGKFTGTASLVAATGDETAFTLNYTTNKLTSGDDYGLKIVQTDTASPEYSYLIWAGIGGTMKMELQNTGVLKTAGDIYAGDGNGNFWGCKIRPWDEFPVILSERNFAAAGNGVEMTQGTISNAAGQFIATAILPTYNQTNTASATDFFINRTITAVGSGAQKFADFQADAVSQYDIRVMKVVCDHQTHAALNAEATTDNALIWQQPANSLLLAVKMVLTQQFVATGLTDLDITVGENGGDVDGLLVQAMDLQSDAVASAYSTRGALWNGGAVGTEYYTAAAKDWYGFVTATGANLNTLTAGTVTFYFTWRQL